MIPFPTLVLDSWSMQRSEEESLDRAVREHLRERGCALLRCAQGLDAAQFERRARVACGVLVADNGEHNRVEAGADSVFTPTEYPADLKILWHNENSFLDVMPARILFGCVIAPNVGGATPLLENEALVERLDPAIVKRFRDKGVQYVRHYVPGLHRPWQQILRAATKEDAERYCAQHAMEIRWDVGVPTTTSVRPAFCVHPDTGRDVFIAQPLHWHPRALPTDTAQELIEFLGRENLPRNCYFGDGTEISDSIIDELISVSEQLEQSFAWQPGDILAVDNLRFSHARNPYKGDRRLLVAMGPLLRFDRNSKSGASRLE